MLGNYLQQTTSADDIFRCIFSWRFMPGLKNDSTSMRQVPKECVVAHSHVSLTHICLMDFPFLINLTIPFPILGLLGGIFNFFI